MYERFEPSVRLKRAVALRYEPGSYAPFVIGKASGTAVARMEHLATKSAVPVVKDDFLALSLSNYDIGNFVPHEYWELVARILLAVKEIKK